MSNLLKSTSIYSFGLILPKIINYILVPIYTRYMSTADYGIVSSMTVMSTILLVVFTFAIERSIYRLYFEYNSENEKREFLGTISLLIYLLSLTTAVTLFIFKDILNLVFQKIPFFPYYLYMILWTYVLVFINVTKLILQVKEKPILFVSLSLTQFLLNCMLILVFVIQRGQGALGMLKAVLFSNLIIIPVTLYLNISSIKFTFNKKMALGAFKLSWPFVPSLLSAWILNLSNRIFIERYFSLSDVGIFSLAYTLAGVVLVVSNAFNQAYNPVFFRLANSKDQETSLVQIGKYNHVYALAILFICFNLSFFSKELIYYMFDEKYRGVVKLIPLISFAYLISQITGLFNMMIYQKKKTKELMVLALFSAGVTVILNYLLIPKFGIMGAAFATILSFMVVFVGTYTYAKHCYFVSIGLSKVALYSVILFSMVFLLNYQSIFELWKVSIFKVMFSLVTTYFLYNAVKKTLGKDIIPFWKINLKS